MPLLLLGCMPAAEETLLEELRVISIRGEPPVIDVILGTRVDATVFRPDEADVTVALWTCTPGTLGCLEAGTEEDPEALATWTTVASPASEDVSHFVVPRPWLAAADGLPPAQVWALACRPGLCPLLDTLAANPAPGSEAWRGAVADLADPRSLLRRLPLSGTAASFRILSLLSSSLDEPRPTNPLATLVEPARLEVQSGASLKLTFDVAHASAVTAWPLASEGGFAVADYPVRNGRVEVELVAGDAESEDQPPVPAGTSIRVYVAFEADDGGSALWRGQVEVVGGG